MMKVRQTSVNKIVFVWMAASVVLGLVWVFLLFRIYIVKTTPVISVVMSTYNRSDLLPRAIDSILNQTYKDFEFIIINDGSTDGTSDVLKSYAARDKRIRIIENEGNKGLVYSLNRGLDLARGKYIAMMNDDDFSLPVRFQVQANFLNQNPSITVVGTNNYTHIPPEKDFSFISRKQSFKALIPYVIQPYDLTDIAITSYFQVPILHPSSMIRRSFLNQHNIRYSTDYPSAEDTPFWHEIILKGGSIIQLPVPLVFRGSSSKKKNYYSQQLNSYHRFLKNSLSEIWPHITTQKWLTRDDLCSILKAMLPHVGTRPYLTVDAINHLQQKYKCSKTP